MTAIPVLVLSGFLGSGKTTLLLRLVHAARERGLEPAILMNELGQLDIDGHLVQNELSGLSVEKLLDGCICCDKKSEVSAAVEQLIRRAPDLIVIELTGVANPEEIADCLSEPQLLNRVQLKQIVTVLDAELVLDYNSIFSSDRNLVETLRSQMTVADLLLLNKTDLVPPRQLAKIEKAVRKYNESASIIHTTYSQMEMHVLLDGISQNPNQSVGKRNPFQVVKTANLQGYEHAHVHQGDNNGNRSYSRLVSLMLPCAKPIKAKEVERFVKSCGSKLLRAKGYLKLENEQHCHLIQVAANRIRWQPTLYNGDTYLVLIGLELDTSRIRDEWASLSASHSI